MTDSIPKHAQVVVVGGGITGCATAYHLARLGVRDVVVLECNQLTSGTSWHAAGIVGPLRSSMNLTRLAKYAIELFAELERETGQATGYQQTGGLWLAQTAARLEELKRIKAMGDRSRLDTEILTPAQIGERLPLLHTEDLTGGLWVEQDGQVNPVDLCMAYARAAKAGGVKIREDCPVVDIETFPEGGVDAVLLEDGTRIQCDLLVIAAGAWSRQLGGMAGVNIPLASCEHIYVVTDLIANLGPFPIVRDLDNGIYLKGDSGKLVLGAFESNPKPWRPQSDDVAFLMFDQD